jgi:alpha-N-arabinofuranosidase
MKTLVAWLLAAAASFCSIRSSAADSGVALSILTDHVTGQIRPGIYGQSIQLSDISAEMVSNGGFENSPGTAWPVEGGELRTPPLDGAPMQRMAFGNLNWSDFDLRLEARRTTPDGNIVIGFRVNDKNASALVLGPEQRWLERADGDKTETPWTGPGKIITGQTYDVRIRCEGRHIEGWLDGALLFNWTDSDPATNGNLTIGASGGSAAFGDIALVDLLGRLLISGVPTPALNWQAVGTAEVSIDTDRPQSGKSSLHIAADDPACGVQQNHFRFQAGDSIHGSLWLRGSAPDGLEVRFVDAGEVLAETDVPPPTSDWQEYPLELIPSLGSGDAKLQIIARGSANAWLDQISLMPDSAKSIGGFRPDLVNAIAGLHPAFLRWTDASPAEIDPFVNLCKRIGAEPMIVIPNESPRDARDFVEYCNGPADSKKGAIRAANGHAAPYHVKYWELDDASKTAGYAIAMKQADPTIQIVADDADSADIVRVSTTNLKAQKRLYLSDWTAGGNNWRGGLATAEILESFEGDSRVAMASPEALLHRYAADSTALINFDGQSVLPSAVYPVLALFRNHFLPNRLAIMGESEPLKVVATQSADKRTIFWKAVNPSDHAVNVNLAIGGGFTPALVHLILIAPGDLSARNVLYQASVAARQGYVMYAKGAASFTLPRWSVAVLELRR